MAFICSDCGYHRYTSFDRCNVCKSDDVIEVEDSELFSYKQAIVNKDNIKKQSFKKQISNEKEVSTENSTSIKTKKGWDSYSEKDFDDLSAKTSKFIWSCGKFFEIVMYVFAIFILCFGMIHAFIITKGFFEMGFAAILVLLLYLLIIAVIFGVFIFIGKLYMYFFSWFALMLRNSTINKNK